MTSQCLGLLANPRASLLCRFSSSSLLCHCIAHFLHHNNPRKSPYDTASLCLPHQPGCLPTALRPSPVTMPPCDPAPQCDSWQQIVIFCPGRCCRITLQICTLKHRSKQDISPPRRRSTCPIISCLDLQLLLFIRALALPSKLPYFLLVDTCGLSYQM